MNAENIYKLIEQTFTVNKALLTEGFINEYLDSRDSKNFDEKWIDAYEHMKVLSSSNKEFLVQDNTLREKIFKIVVSISSSYELAEYVSDDAGLIQLHHVHTIHTVAMALFQPKSPPRMLHLRYFLLYLLPLVCHALLSVVSIIQ